MLSCENLKADECQNFGDNNGDKQCINIDGSCQLVEYRDLPDKQCNKFTTDNLYYRCTSKNNECVAENKECSELPIEFCQDDEKKILNSCVFNANENKCQIEETPKEEEETLDKPNANNEGDNKDDKKSDSNSSGSNNSSRNNSYIPQKIHFTLLTFFIFSILF